MEKKRLEKISRNELLALNTRLARENERLKEKVLELSNDALTGLPNRHVLKQIEQRVLSESERYGGFVGMIFADINKIKKINDTRGHETGDLVIQEFAKQLSAIFNRGDDTVVRMGGDEFFCAWVIVEPGEIEKTHAWIKKVRRRLSSIQLQNPPVEFSASIGFAYADPKKTSFKELMGLADDDMYKKKGRRRRK